ncbi:YutD family protein [Dolosigranulum savutiense]|uniref:YutD family protein n=1 Tax=Dolosigranulum savutiense TaxID=3110288 RepID=A0AB74TTG8_9LACT
MAQKKSVDKKTEQFIEQQLDLMDDKRLIRKIDSEHLLINGTKYEIMQDVKEALDLTRLENRYTEFFEKYDYIVGDLSREALRLRGFYADHQRKVPVDMRISYLEDYLAEFCNFGCPYFVLKRLAPKKHFKPYNSKDNQQYHKKKAKFKKKPNKTK